MKKLLALLFTLVVAFSLTMPVFAQEASAGGGQESAKGEKKGKKAKKAKKSKKAEKKAEEAPK